jgi:VIT1/CCC1 family predicted Fe2+/Mn2+ transporter
LSDDAAATAADAEVDETGAAAGNEEAEEAEEKEVTAGYDSGATYAGASV